jgi:hypothetical protein
LLGGVGAAGAYVLAACSGDDPVSTGDAPTTTTPAPVVLGESFDRNTLLVPGIPQRMPFLLFAASGGLIERADAPAELTFSFTLQGGGATMPDVTVARAGDAVDRVYYPAVATFPSVGVWDVATDLDGLPLTSSVAVNEQTTVPQVGDPLPAAPTPTVADPLGVTTLCTRDPQCPFHEVSLADALAAGRPVAVLLSTPAYCQVAICGPVLDLLVDQPPAIDTIHIEVFPNGPPADDATNVSPLVNDTFGLTYEPALFVAGADGRIAARLDNIYDAPELAAALALV